MAGHSSWPKGREQVEEGESWSPHETTSNQPAPTTGRLADLLQPRGFGELRPYEPSLRENLVARIGTAGQALGLDKYRAWETGRRMVDLLDWTTPVGMAISLDEARRAYREGDLIGTTLGAVGGVPIIGRPGAKALKAGGRVLAEQLAKKPTGAARDALSETAPLAVQPNQGTPLASPLPDELAELFREGVQPSAPHSPIPRNHPARGVLPVENKPGAIVDQQGNAFTHVLPDQTGIDAGTALREADVAANAANNAPEKVPVITTPSQTRDRLMSVPAQPKPGTASETPYSELVGLFREGVQPNVPQTPILRYDPPRGVPPRIADLIANRYVRDKIIENIERGIRMGGLDWFNAEPLRLAFIDELKALEGGQRFNHFFDLFGATTALSKARENLRNTSFYYTLSDGRRLPDVNPYPYGHLAQALHRRNVERVWSGGLDPLTFPKSVSISANAKGNYLPVTVDSNIFRQAAMLSGDTRFLTTFLPIKSGGSRNIRREYNAGLISPEELRQPSYWSPAPRKNEYPAMEQYFQGIARELGMTPAQAEASAWLGGAELTGLGSDPSKKLMDFYKDSLLRTAIEKNMDPRDVLRRTIRGQLALLTLGGVALVPQLRSPEEGHR